MSASNKKTGRLNTASDGQTHEAFAPTLRELRLGEHHLREIHRRAKAGDSMAQRELALAYCRGIGVRRDGPYAVKWIILAADAGDTEARRHLNYFLKGFPVDEIAEGRRLVARHRGEPVPTFGLRAEDTL
ncbi:MAG: sel1 repeat family protein, partial [Verrucomicrobiae bacterium]|nr:sel1 repeat family protein [Verrucomicrobiae bacterium]